MGATRDSRPPFAAGFVGRGHVHPRDRTIEGADPSPVAARPGECFLRELLGPRVITNQQAHAAHDLSVALAEELLERHRLVSIRIYEPVRTRLV